MRTRAYAGAAAATLFLALGVAGPAAASTVTINVDPATACTTDGSWWPMEWLCQDYDNPVVHPGDTIQTNWAGGFWGDNDRYPWTVTSTVLRTYDCATEPSQAIPNAVLSPDGGTLTVAIPSALNLEFEQVSDACIGDFLDIGLSRLDESPVHTSTVTIDLRLQRQASSPTNVTARRTSSTAASLSWAAPAMTGGTAIASYKVTRTASTGTWSTTVGASVRKYTFSALKAGTAYSLSVQAVNATGTSLPVAVTAPGSASALAAAASVSVSRTANNAATIKWAPPPVLAGKTITGYKVARDGVDSYGGGAFSKLVSAATRSFTMNYLVTGNTYKLTVTPVYSGGVGPSAQGSVRIG